MKVLSVQDGTPIVEDLVNTIVANREYLSEIDGAIGDGDHGINMAKGFNLCAESIKGKSLTVAEALDVLSDSLMEGIGGSMGPLYGSIFMGMADSVRDSSQIDANAFGQMLRDGLSCLQDVSTAGVGDKCLMDTLIPAVEAYSQAQQQRKSFVESLNLMKAAAESGRDSTIDLVAKIGRASRLGERSRGVLDAGATSCCLILNQLADSVEQRLA
ncbi:dihydroxyacetone kinase subunit DhaL [Pragia fontium]|uniref:Dihydroxyacetone kinase DhaL subunit n=2 Tax=Pragia fontium TaxID=82985 RepID=A0AAJ4W875_9GAMM|nr:dihydroxyacetone kinase subunit DhaL [Pragia fontium]AKJ41164.1 dihydroxyacetone kinase [Pragia fontium]SFC11713.1 dihydroxyacetone kinase DhaL subunit [Pragia fontium DSM 5563 = ATCC 49100]SUB81371.1 PTS-dependent dihydroxyacetone kinase, ADP-binding subunit dhaL [Pragia fontium]VEJ53590.1 PTS-dependent dihydroxyacetone kinase, ADP-binding subunit dhaL [Pragia fontium]GKX63361.1 dihydroxyacetone kinase subunit L [Pragia fontium]